MKRSFARKFYLYSSSTHHGLGWDGCYVIFIDVIFRLIDFEYCIFYNVSVWYLCVENQYKHLPKVLRFLQQHAPVFSYILRKFDFVMNIRRIDISQLFLKNIGHTFCFVCMTQSCLRNGGVEGLFICFTLISKEIIGNPSETWTTDSSYSLRIKTFWAGAHQCSIVMLCNHGVKTANTSDEAGRYFQKVL